MRTSLAKPHRKDVPRTILRGTVEYPDKTGFYVGVAAALKLRMNEAFAQSITAAEEAARAVDESELEIIDDETEVHTEQGTTA